MRGALFLNRVRGLTIASFAVVFLALNGCVQEIERPGAETATPVATAAPELTPTSTSTVPPSQSPTPTATATLAPPQPTPTPTPTATPTPPPTPTATTTPKAPSPPGPTPTPPVGGVISGGLFLQMTNVPRESVVYQHHLHKRAHHSRRRSQRQWRTGRRGRGGQVHRYRVVGTSAQPDRGGRQRLPGEQGQRGAGRYLYTLNRTGVISGGISSLPDDQRAQGERGPYQHHLHKRAHHSRRRSQLSKSNWRTGRRGRGGQVHRYRVVGTSAQFVCAMEDVLEVYQRPYDGNEVLVCMDETSKQQVKETRVPRPAAPGLSAAYDYEYERNGVSSLFMLFAGRSESVARRWTGRM